MTPTIDRTDPITDLRSVTCSRGAPSARNLLVTVFGDAVLPHGDETAVSVRSLAALLAPFGVNERLVRTSLTRLVNDGLLSTRVEGRRSFYRVAPGSLELFARADDRIYHGDPPAWDGSWTIVVIDGTESTAPARARLRQELAWVGLGVVAPNVMASPLVPAETAAAVVAHVGGFTDVLVARARVTAGAGTIGADELARRCAPLDETAQRYASFTERFGRFAPDALAALAAEDACKLRILLVSTFRRIVLADPSLPPELLPPDWVGDRARAVAARVYAACAGRSEDHLLAVTETVGGPLDPIPPARFARRFTAR